MKTTVSRFEISGVDGMAHVLFTTNVNGKQTEYNCPLFKKNSEDVKFMESVVQFVKLKVGEVND